MPRSLAGAGAAGWQGLLPSGRHDERASGADRPTGSAGTLAPRNGLRHSPLSLAVFGSVIVLAFRGLLGHERDWVSEATRFVSRSTPRK